MEKSRINVLTYLACGLSVFAGVAVIYYGFELVSVPHSSQQSESAYVLVGCVLVLVGLIASALRMKSQMGS